VSDTVKDMSEAGKAYGITADLTDRTAAEAVCRQLAAEHEDATLLVNAAGLFLPKPFLDHDGADYDSYQELNRAIGSARGHAGQLRRLPPAWPDGTSATRPHPPGIRWPGGSQPGPFERDEVDFPPNRPGLLPAHQSA
jgi:hypothetical protein